MSSRDLTILENQIDIWLLDDSQPYSDSDIDDLKSLLNPSELDRQQRFAFARDRNQYILARALLRTTLSEYEPSIKPEQWRFDFNPWGKPSINPAHQANLQFNLSHTHNCIALGVRRFDAIGIDVECLQRGNDLASLAEHSFTTVEQNYIFAGGQQELQQRFFKVWTLKEALLKAHGQGLSLGIKHFEFDISAGKITLNTSKDLGVHNWFFHCSDISPDHTLAVAAPRRANLSVAPTVNCYRCRPMAGFTVTQLP